LTLFDARTGQQLQHIQKAHDQHTNVAFSADSKLLATVGHDGVCNIWTVQATPTQGSAGGR
jgi:WD40 repeat protein